MRQHPDPDPDPDPDEDGLEAWRTPVYQGSGLSVRALTAEELQRFLDAYQRQPAQLLGSGWTALNPSAHPVGGPRTLHGPNLSPLDPSRRSRPSRSPAALAAPPWRNTGGTGRRSWPAGRAA